MENDNSLETSRNTDGPARVRCKPVERRPTFAAHGGCGEAGWARPCGPGDLGVGGDLDLKPFCAEIGTLEGEAGRPAWDPQVLISLWIYAYKDGIGSAREIARRCEYHPAYQWLTGMEVVNYHTLADFRIAHQAALDGFFIEVLGVLSHQGLITLRRVMHDGTKIKAAAWIRVFTVKLPLRII